MDLDAAGRVCDATLGSGRVEGRRVMVGVAGWGGGSRDPGAACAPSALSTDQVY